MRVNLGLNELPKAVLAFSVEHDVLQETIGVLLIPNDSRPRIGLRQLHDVLK